jgi:hypothetical protein
MTSSDLASNSLKGATMAFRWAARSEAPRVLLNALVLKGSIMAEGIQVDELEGTKA